MLAHDEGGRQLAETVGEGRTAAGTADRIACFAKVDALIGAIGVPLARLKRRNGEVGES